MKVFARQITLLCFLYAASHAQNPVCPSPYVYMDGGTFIKVYDPSQPLSANNPSNTSIPTIGSGLALMPNINGGTLCPTFYSTMNGNYYYWDGFSWIGTGHSTGSSSAVNIGGCGSFIYNLVGSTGQVYRYDGTGNGTYLTTLSGFSGGGPYDLTSDCNCNFYAMVTSTSTGQSMVRYNSSGVPTGSFALVNMPHTSAGNGFGIIGNMVYVKTTLTNGFFIGTISGSAITFTQVTGFLASPSDLATCPTCNVPPPQLPAQMSTGTLSCYTPTVSLAVTTTASPVTYSWSGPGILGSVTGSAISLSTPGTYSCLVNYLGCPSSQVLLSTAVQTNTSAVSAHLTHTGNICITANEQQVIAVNHNSTAQLVTWSGPGITNVTTDSLMITGGGCFSVQVTDPVTGCYATDVVTFAETPTISVAVNTNTFCALPITGSPAHATITASGAATHSFYPDLFINVSSSSGPSVVVSAGINAALAGMVMVVGSNDFCTDTSFVHLTIYPNPTVALSSASICPGNSHVFSASGAATYTWSGNGLQTAYGSSVSASPTITSTYSIVASQYGCLSPVKYVTLTVLPVPVVSLTPSAGHICLGSSASLTASGTAASYSWTPVGAMPMSVGAMMVVTPSVSQVYSVTGSLNGCTASAVATVQVQAPPTLSMSLSAQSMCFKNYNGSPNSIIVQPGGAAAYTMLPGPNFTVNNPSGPAMQLIPAGPPIQSVTVVSATLIGKLGVCTVTKTQAFSILPNPVVVLSPPNQSICPGEAVVFVANGATTYTWAQAPGLHLYQPNSVIANPKVTSSFGVIGSSMGCHSDKKNAVLLVKPVPSLTVAVASSTVCSGNMVRLSVAGNAETYSWTPSEHLTSSTGLTVYASPNVTTLYKVTGYLNSCTNQAVTTISAITVPTISAIATQSVVCSGSKTTLKASGAISFSWFPKQTLDLDIGGIVHASPNVTTNYTVFGYNGICSGSTAVQVRTIERPDLRVFTEGGQNSICSGSLLPIMTSGARNYQWAPAPYVMMVSSNTMVLAGPPVTTNFTITGTNTEGTVVCPQVVNFSVVVVPRAVPLVSGGQRICAGDLITLEAKGGNSFRWLPEEGLNEVKEARVVANPTVSTVYSVDVSHSGYCGTTATVMVEVVPKPSVFAGRDTSWNVNDVIYLTASSSGSVTWVTGEAIVCPGCATTQVYPGRSECYVAQAENEFGCRASDVVCLEIRQDFYFYVPNSFTPDGDGLNDVFMVYGENVSDVRVEIFDRWGQRVFYSDDPSVGWDGTFQGSGCKPGTYVYKMSYKGLDRKTYEKAGHVTVIR